MLEATGVDKLGPWPILQFAAAVIVLMGVGYAIFKGSRDKGGQDNTDDAPEQRWFFDGPIKVALDTLAGIYRVLGEIREENKEAERDRRADHKEHMTVLRELADRMPRRRS